MIRLSLMDFKGFSNEDIKKIKKLHEEGPFVLRKNGAESVEQLTYKPIRHSTNSKILNESRNFVTKDLHSNISKENIPVQHSKPNDARLSFANQSVGLEKNVNNSTLSSTADTVIEKLATDFNHCNSDDRFPKTVAILVGQDKSYEVIESPLVSEELQDGQNKVYLLESSVTSDQNGHTKTSLEVFQERQKQMEEQNKRRKEILTKAIADRKRQTQHEAKKLLQIQDELNKLDALLSTDVAILRNHIEIASVEFNEAQKRYDRAENEYVDAKMHLFGKLERKELLTEHLCRIIEVNEQRKSKKLSDLMAKLELSDEKSLLKQDPLNNPLISANLDEISYAVCNTLKNPSKALSKNKFTSLVDTSSQSLELSHQAAFLSDKLITLNNMVKVDNTHDSVPHLIKNSLYLASEAQDFLTAQSDINK